MWISKMLEKVYPNTGMLNPVEFIDMERLHFALNSFIYLIQFVYEHNENIVRDLNRPILWDEKKYCILENNAIEQLNIYSNNKNNLFNIIKNTSTPIGRRELRYKLLTPIVNSLLKIIS